MAKTSNELPLGFGMALSQNSEALRTFLNLSATEKQKIINKAHNVNSKHEMSALVQSIANSPPSM